MKIIHRDEIEQAIDLPSIFRAVEEGFSLYSQNKTVIPPVAKLNFSDPAGDCHIKYGYSQSGDTYVVKIASSFYQNEKMGLPSGNGLMLLFDKNTGKPLCLLQDEGLLTDLRTAAAGAVAAKYLAPKKVTCIGIVGTGAQAFHQLQFLPLVTPCKNVMVWGRDLSKAEKFQQNPLLKNFKIHIASSLEDLAQACNLIVTTTSAKAPLILSQHVKKGTHITAVGADDKGKQELDPNIFSFADRIVVDSKSQCKLFGDTSYALHEKIIQEEQMIELGEVIIHPHLRRTDEDQITIADLTGVAIQDLQIASQIYKLVSY